MFSPFRGPAGSREPSLLPCARRRAPGLRRINGLETACQLAQSYCTEDCCRRSFHMAQNFQQRRARASRRRRAAPRPFRIRCQPRALAAQLGARVPPVAAAPVPSPRQPAADFAPLVDGLAGHRRHLGDGEARARPTSLSCDPTAAGAGFPSFAVRRLPAPLLRAAGPGGTGFFFRSSRPRTASSALRSARASSSTRRATS